MRTTIWNGFSSHSRWDTFTSSDGSSNSSSFTSETRGFEGVTTSSTINEFSLALTKTKKVAETISYLHLEGVDVFYLTN
jgi:hypothetical protein